MIPKIGFMQGRLSPVINGLIQAFPWEHWKDEFYLAKNINIQLMEWTLDQKRLYENPLLTEIGRSEIRSLCMQHAINIPSLTGDCFMQAPLWKARGIERNVLEKDFVAIGQSCAEMGIRIIVLPLVDNGRIENMAQEDDLISFLKNQVSFLAALNLKVAFESEYEPQELTRFITRLDPALFGINYDVGNSAALGYNPMDEFNSYGDRVINVHIKDRKRGGATVPLGTGDAKFDIVFSSLLKLKYSGNFILQTARSINDDHVSVLAGYRDRTAKWLQKNAS